MIINEYGNAYIFAVSWFLMTVVVGFNWPVEHDHAVGVIVDGELVFASEEERWTKHKHSVHELPINALK
jgi:carbamoyltransferase